MAVLMLSGPASPCLESILFLLYKALWRIANALR